MTNSRKLRRRSERSNCLLHNSLQQGVALTIHCWPEFSLLGGPRYGCRAAHEPGLTVNEPDNDWQASKAPGNASLCFKLRHHPGCSLSAQACASLPCPFLAPSIPVCLTPTGTEFAGHSSPMHALRLHNDGQACRRIRCFGRTMGDAHQVVAPEPDANRHALTGNRDPVLIALSRLGRRKSGCSDSDRQAQKAGISGRQGKSLYLRRRSYSFEKRGVHLSDPSRASRDPSSIRLRAGPTTRRGGS